MTDRLHVLIAGGGVAAVELALALHDLAGERVRLTIVAPQPDFELRPLSTTVPFSAGAVQGHGLQELCERVGAELVAEEVTAVEPERHAVRLGNRRSLEYDALVLAVGARRTIAFARAITFSGDPADRAYNGLLADLEEHWTRSVAFVVPPGPTWPIPLYELALQTARDVRAMGIEDLRLELVSPEVTPLALFGEQASAAVASLLDGAGISFRGGCTARADEHGALVLDPGATPLGAERVVTLPVLQGPLLAGVPSDADGFIPIDAEGRVRGLPDVHAAGDGTSFPVKQGGLACQLADAIAGQLAARAGADVVPEPFRPVLRGHVLTGDGALDVEDAGIMDASAGALRLWSAAHKVEGRYLSPWLAERQGAPVAPPAPEGEHLDVEVPLEAPAG